MTTHTLDELSEEELERMASRVAAATVGPWTPNSVDEDLAPHVSVIELGVCNELGTCKLIELIGATAADHDFIVNARQDMPRLLHAVRCLRARLQSVGTSNDDLERHSMRSAGEDALRVSRSM